MLDVVTFKEANGSLSNVVRVHPYAAVRRVVALPERWARFPELGQSPQELALPLSVQFQSARGHRVPSAWRRPGAA